jgi:ribosomal protein S18 acetylase RimI-like enzyme
MRFVDKSGHDFYGIVPNDTYYSLNIYEGNNLEDFIHKERVGWATLSLMEKRASDERVVYLQEIEVIPAYQRRGIGAHLNKIIVAIGKFYNATKIIGIYDPKHEGAERWYDAMLYSVIRDNRGMKIIEKLV